jgi:hypothetical protein
MRIIYKPSSFYLSKEDWTELIMDSIRKIKSTRVGYLLMMNIKDDLSIVSQSSYGSSFYHPKYSILGDKFEIVIPDTPYLTQVRVVNPNVEFNNPIFNFKDIEYYNLYQISQNNIVKKPIEFSSEIFKLTKWENQPYCVMLFHELVHYVRYKKGLRSETLEEENTIYGCNKVLKIDDIIITENQFRREMGLNPRIDHNGKFINVYNSNCNQERLNLSDFIQY